LIWILARFAFRKIRHKREELQQCDEAGTSGDTTVDGNVSSVARMRRFQ